MNNKITTEYWCQKCKGFHRRKSKIGKSHLKFRPGYGELWNYKQNKPIK